MDLDLQQQILKRLSELPEDVRAAIQSADLGKKIQAIGQKHSLHVDQIGKLQDEVLLVMLGFADPGEFTEQLAGEIGTTPEQSIELATEVGNEIFMPIRKSMQEWSEQHAAQEDADFVLDTLGPPAVSKAPTPGPDVSMPSSVTASNSTPAPAAAPKTPAPAPVPTPVKEISAADLALTERKTSIAPAPPAAKSETPPAKPQNYKADPYREPVE